MKRQTASYAFIALLVLVMTTQSCELDVTVEFVLIFNGHTAERFRDEGAAVNEGGIQGFLAVISPPERFPSVPVHIELREIGE